jgi:Zn-dependent protease with chaperone function
MNFFEQQEHARRQTRKLVILFALAVAGIVVAVNLAMALIWTLSHGSVAPGMQRYPTGFFATNTLVTMALIGIGTLIETWNLRDGGDAVAAMAGGRLVPPSSTDPHERRLLNVVEEMALASGIACPRVYLLEREDAINAFAAGYNRNEAVVAVTRGALLRLTRDELQGVVAHEFSHILNGDMRLNIRLIGLLFGIQMLAGFGHQLLDLGTRTWSRREREEKGPSAQLMLLAAGMALVAIGYIGVLFGRLIKSAVSRQREFLADASAVQFTRNPDGIGGALRKIGGLSRSMRLGSRILNPHAELLSHLFLGAPKLASVNGLLATHPTIEERLRRIYGRDVEPLDAPELLASADAAPGLPDISYVPTAGESTPWLAFGNSAMPQAVIPPELDGALREPQAACAVVYALLLDNGPMREAQLRVLREQAPQQATLVPWLAETIALLPKSARLPLLDRVTPTLRQLSQPARDALLAVAGRMIAADQRISLAEFVLQTVLARRMAARAGRATPIRFDELATIAPDCILLLSLVAHVAAREAGTEEAASALFEQAIGRCSLAPGKAELVPAGAIDFARVRDALARAAQLAPLAKPALIKALVAAAGDADPMPMATADLLRALCAAIDAPIPAAVAATYGAYHVELEP